MLSHIPFWNIIPATIFTNKRSYSLMLSQMHFQIWPCVVFLCAVLKSTVKFINILVSLLVISKNPKLSVGLVTSGYWAGELLYFWFFVCRCMIGEMLRHFETFIAIWECTLEYSNWEMAFKMLPIFGQFLKYFFAIR